jgi:hypothetical protein
MIEKWNSDCFCVSLDSAALRAALNAQSTGLAALIETRCPNLFAALPVFVSRPQIDAMAAVVAAVEETAIATLCSPTRRTSRATTRARTAFSWGSTSISAPMVRA